MDATFIILGILLFIVFCGLLGWVIKLIGFIFGLLIDGLSNFAGCLFWVIIIIVLIIGFGSGL